MEERAERPVDMRRLAASMAVRADQRRAAIEAGALVGMAVRLRRPPARPRARSARPAPARRSLQDLVHARTPSAHSTATGRGSASPSAWLSASLRSIAIHSCRKPCAAGEAGANVPTGWLAHRALLDRAGKRDRRPVGVLLARLPVQRAAQVEHREHRQDRRVALGMGLDLAWSPARTRGPRAATAAAARSRSRRRADLGADLVEHRRAVEDDPLVAPREVLGELRQPAALPSRASSESSSRSNSSAGSSVEPRHVGLADQLLAGSTSFEKTLSAAVLPARIDAVKEAGSARGVEVPQQRARGTRSPPSTTRGWRRWWSSRRRP